MRLFLSTTEFAGAARFRRASCFPTMMDKTFVFAVVDRVNHPLYGRSWSYQKFKAHDEQ